MPALDAGNIINLSDSRLLNRGRKPSLGVIIELEKLPADERQRIMERSMSAKQRADAERSIQVMANSPIAAIGKQIQEIANKIPKLPDFSGLAKLQTPRFTEDFLPALRGYKTSSLATDLIYQPTLPPAITPRTDNLVISNRLDTIERRLRSIQDKQSRVPAPVHRTKFKLTPSSYEPELKELQLGNASVSFRGSRIEAEILKRLFLKPTSMKKKWDYSEFLESNRKQLRDIGAQDWKQIRSAINRIQVKIAKETRQKKTDIILTDVGFYINPKYLT